MSGDPSDIVNVALPTGLFGVAVIKGLEIWFHVIRDRRKERRSESEGGDVRGEVDRAKNEILVALGKVENVVSRLADRVEYHGERIAVLEDRSGRKDPRTPNPITQPPRRSRGG